MERHAEPQRQIRYVASGPVRQHPQALLLEDPMLAFQVFGAKEIAVYVIVVVLAVIAIVWGLMRRRTKA
jgi:hypothetical protein